MKSILLASASIVAFAGVAAAEVSFSGSAELGYQDSTGAAAGADDEYGYFAAINLDVALSAELDNGLTVTASADVDELDAGDADFGGVTLKIASETASLTYGDVENAAAALWDGVGSMDADGFYEQDGETVLRADATFGGFETAVSYEVDAAMTGLQDLNVAAKGSVGSFSTIFAYEAGDTHDEIFAVRAGTTFGGADIALGYASNETTGAASTGVEVVYPVGPVTVTASYVMEEVGDDNWDIKAAYANGPIAVSVKTDESDDWEVEGSYDAGNGLNVFAGIVDGGDDYYVAGTYGLGGGAEILVAYVEDGGALNGDNEIGAKDLENGTTVAVTFEF